MQVSVFTDVLHNSAFKFLWLKTTKYDVIIYYKSLTKQRPDIRALNRRQLQEDANNWEYYKF
jgi:hypothetical protein